MRLSKYFKDSIYFLIIGLSLSGTYYISTQSEKPALFITKQQSSLNLQNNFWQYFGLGQKRLASSLLWIATILESDHDHYKNRDLNSWMFLRFNTISFLEPKFYENYAFGGVYLSIVKDDLTGASVIYDKGLSMYPYDYSLLKDAGFHYYFEVGNFEKALPIYKKLVNINQPSPQIVSTLARLESNLGRKEDALNLLHDRYQQLNDKSSVIALKTYSSMYSLKAEIDLECLNSKHATSQNCSLIDLDGEKYILTQGKYKAAKDWIPFRIKAKKKAHSDVSL